MVKVTKRSDDLSRIIIPKEVRHMLILNGNDDIDFVIEDSGRVYIEKHLPDDIRQNKEIRALKQCAGDMLSSPAWTSDVKEKVLGILCDAINILQEEFE